jgi:hypothetical protein
MPAIKGNDARAILHCGGTVIQKSWLLHPRRSHCKVAQAAPHTPFDRYETSDSAPGQVLDRSDIHRDTPYY